MRGRPTPDTDVAVMYFDYCTGLTTAEVATKYGTSGKLVRYHFNRRNLPLRSGLNEMPDETWKPILNYEGYYEVSDHGRVRSVARVYPFTRDGATFMQFRPGRAMKTHVKKSGYVEVCLRAAALGRKSKPRLVHALVLEAFVGPRPQAHMQGCHGDGNKLNNHVSNLRWDTPLGNAADNIRLNRTARTSHCPKGHKKRIDKNGYGRCRICNTEQARARRTARRAA